MTKPTSEKEFDCIEYKRRVQQEIFEKIKDMTPEQEIEFFRKAAETGPFASLLRRIGNRNRIGGPSRPASAVASNSSKHEQE